MISNKLGGEGVPVVFFILHPVETFLSNVHLDPTFFTDLAHFKLNNIFKKKKDSLYYGGKNTSNAACKGEGSHMIKLLKEAIN